MYTAIIKLQTKRKALIEAVGFENYSTYWRNDMKKIKTLFKVDRETGLAINEVNKESEWVLKGEGVATIKYDGSACFYDKGVLYKRLDRKLKGKYSKIARTLGDKFVPEEHMFNTLPEGAIPCEERPAAHSLHFPHWVPVGSGPEDAFHREALSKATLRDGETYELVGPKVCGNTYKLSGHELWRHGEEKLEITDFSFEGLKAFLSEFNGEGIVWHHPDGRCVKLRRKDFGFEFGLPDPRNNKSYKNKM